MLLEKILKNCNVIKVIGSTDIEITGIEYNSKKVQKGNLFCCIKGLHVDGHKYALEAVRSGASVVMLEQDIELPQTTVKIFVNDVSTEIGKAADAYYEYPLREAKLIGITGTNGKTTVTYLVKNVLEAAGKKTGVIGTIQNMIGDTPVIAERTTPEAPELFSLFRQMVDAGVEYVIMEVSSHALSLKRVAACHFSYAAFTNLSQDHLDFHNTMDAYRSAKAILFEKSDVSIINMDDASGQYMKESARGKIVTCGVYEKWDLFGDNVHLDAKGASFDLHYKGSEIKINLKTSGIFSVYNGLVACGICLAEGINIEKVKIGLEKATVKGRFQQLNTNTDFTVILDYAHTPDGLENILKTVREYAKGRVITLFGCGGDRDSAKRPIMGRIAGEYSDYCIVTSDNPRFEKPMDIIADILPGINQTSCEYTVIENRYEAISYALNYGKKEDIVILAGKGHETYQEISGEKYPFDEAEIVENLLKGSVN